MFIKHKHWLQEKLCCTRCLKYNQISHISKPVRQMESEKATSDRSMQRSGRWLYSAYIYIPNPRWSFNFTFYSLGCRCELISDLISHVGRPADQKNQSWEKQGPSVPFLHIYGLVIRWINIYSSCNPALEFTSLLLNPQCGSGELHAWHSVSMHSMWCCFRSRDYWINTSDGRCIQTTQFNLARHSD